MNVSFITEFNNVYYRVNKRSGKKNLRCFPKCCPTGHANSTFCGQSVRVSVELQKEVHDFPLACFAEFGLLASSNKFTQDSEYPASVISSSIQSTQNLEGSLFRCEVTSTNGQSKYVIEANKTLDAWNYPWTATRHFTGHLHVLRFNLFFFNPHNQTYKFIDSFDSPPFQLSCIRPSQAKGKELYQRFKDETPGNGKQASSTKKGKRNMDGDDDDIDDEEENNVSDEEYDEDDSTVAADEKQNGSKSRRSRGKPYSAKGMDADSGAAGFNDNQSKRKTSKKQRVFYNLIENIAFGNFQQPIEWDPSLSFEGLVDSGLEKTDIGPKSEFSSSIANADSNASNGTNKMQIQHYQQVPSSSSSSSSSATLSLASSSIANPQNTKPESYINLVVLSTLLIRDIILGTNTDFSTYVSDSESEDGHSNGNSHANSTKKSKIDFTRELISYFMKDEEFARNVLIFFKSIWSKEIVDDENSTDLIMKNFTKIMISHMKTFLSTKNMTLRDVEKMLSFLPRNHDKELLFNQGSSNAKGVEKWIEPRIRFLKELRKAACPDDLFVNTPRVPSSMDIEGTWLYIGDDNAGVDISKRLTERGYPGFLFGIIRRAMMKIQININKDWLFIQGSAKLGLDIHQLFSLDGQVHPFVLPPDMPVVFPFRPISYIAYLDYKNRKIHLEETVACLAIAGSVLSFSRDFSLSDDGIEMHITTITSITNSAMQTNDVLGEVSRPYLRVWTHEDEDDLLKNVDHSTFVNQLNKDA